MLGSDNPAQAARRQAVNRPSLLLLLMCGALIGVLAFAVFARVATVGIWNRLAELATGRSLTINTSLPAIVSKIQQLQRLETVEYTMDKIVEGDRQSAIFPDFLAGDKLLLVTHGEVIAGIDMGKLGVADVHIEEHAGGRSIQVHLPPPQVLTVRLDNAQTRVYSRSTGLFVPADPNLESEVRARAEDQFRQAAVSDGILDKARVNAAASVTAMLRGLGFKQVVLN
ncbi:MAG TPA: DUF4230 domain-containing protein [Acidisarcina sp.]